MAQNISGQAYLRGITMKEMEGSIYVLELPEQKN
jgi:hypothetical protein